MEQLSFFGAPVPNNNVNQSACMSALVKCVKLRRTDDAVYWLARFTKHFPQQYRQTRRLLIIAGEDNINVPVQMYAADWFPKALAIKDTKKWFQSAATLVHLICNTQDWWADPVGSYQICLQRRIHREYFKLSEQEQLEWSARKLDLDHMSKHDLLLAFRAKHEIWGKTQDAVSRVKHAEWLVEEARKRHNLSARLTAAIHLRHHKALAGDNNYLAQAEHKLIFGIESMGGEFFPNINPQTIHDSVEKARARLCTPEKPPEWCLDGVHTYGSDRRFAGLMPNMLAVCNMYREYGRLDPADEQKKEHFSTTALFERLKSEDTRIAGWGIH